MSSIRSAARFAVEHWFLVLAVVVNMAVAAPAGAVRYTNDVCETADGEEIEACCTTCWFFCNCTVLDGGDDGGDGDDDGNGDGGSN